MFERGTFFFFVFWSLCLWCHNQCQHVWQKLVCLKLWANLFLLLINKQWTNMTVIWGAKIQSKKKLVAKILKEPPYEAWNWKHCAFSMSSINSALGQATLMERNYSHWACRALVHIRWRFTDHTINFLKPLSSSEILPQINSIQCTLVSYYTLH